jgi:hypothetical protein
MTQYYVTTGGLQRIVQADDAKSACLIVLRELAEAGLAMGWIVICSTRGFGDPERDARIYSTEVGLSELGYVRKEAAE